VPRERGEPRARPGGVPFGEGASRPRPPRCPLRRWLRVGAPGRAEPPRQPRPAGCQCHHDSLAGSQLALVFFRRRWMRHAAARGRRRGLCPRPGAWRSGEAAPCRAPRPLHRPGALTRTAGAHMPPKESYPSAHLRHRFRYIGWLVRKHDPAAADFLLSSTTGVSTSFSFGVQSEAVTAAKVKVNATEARLNVSPLKLMQAVGAPKTSKMTVLFF
jgi:hypothetical protein